jgi:hypothetical protein
VYLYHASRAASNDYHMLLAVPQAIRRHSRGSSGVMKIEPLLSSGGVDRKSSEGFSVNVLVITVTFSQCVSKASVTVRYEQIYTAGKGLASTAGSITWQGAGNLHLSAISNYNMQTLVVCLMLP